MAKPPAAATKPSVEKVPPAVRSSSTRQAIRLRPPSDQTEISAEAKKNTCAHSIHSNPKCHPQIEHSYRQKPTPELRQYRSQNPEVPRFGQPVNETEPPLPEESPTHFVKQNLPASNTAPQRELTASTEASSGSQTDTDDFAEHVRKITERMELRKEEERLQFRVRGVQPSTENFYAAQGLLPESGYGYESEYEYQQHCDFYDANWDGNNYMNYCGDFVADDGELCENYSASMMPMCAQPMSSEIMLVTPQPVTQFVATEQCSNHLQSQPQPQRPMVKNPFVNIFPNQQQLMVVPQPPPVVEFVAVEPPVVEFVPVTPLFQPQPDQLPQGQFAQDIQTQQYIQNHSDPTQQQGWSIPEDQIIDEALRRKVLKIMEELDCPFTPGSQAEPQPEPQIEFACNAIAADFSTFEMGNAFEAQDGLTADHVIQEEDEVILARGHAEERLETPGRVRSMWDDEDDWTNEDLYASKVKIGEEYDDYSVCAEVEEIYVA